jgi:hypothetical protein
MPDIKAAIIGAAEETSPTTSTDVLPLVNAAGTTFKKIKLVTLFEAIDALQYKGVQDCSANPNYPAASAGHVYKVSVAGKIGGASGPNVEAGDTLICNVDSSASGDHATVGSNWSIIQTNVDDPVGRTATQTLTNKRITARTGTTASSATPTPAGDSNDLYTVTALAAAAELQAPSGTPADGQSILIRIKDDGTPRALTYNAIYRAIGVTLPTTTAASKTIYLGCVYNSADSKWDVLGVAEES